MNIKFVSLVILFFGIGALIVFQATQESSSLVKLPSELAPLGKAGTLSRVRVAGKVVADTVRYEVQPELSLTFSISDPGKPAIEASLESSVPVVYKGIKPDMFAAGRDVIIDGDFVGGSLLATKLLTQCPSKYEPPTVK